MSGDAWFQIAGLVGAWVVGGTLGLWLARKDGNR